VAQKVPNQAELNSEKDRRVDREFAAERRRMVAGMWETDRLRNTQGLRRAQKSVLGVYGCIGFQEAMILGGV
jgi:hypothetical protein